MKLTVELSRKSIRQAIQQLERYKKSLDEKCELLCQKLAEIGVDAAVATVSVETGELKDSIRFEKSNDKEYLVIVENDHAALVEFGTGVVGQGTYPGELPAGWGYDERRTPAAHDPIDPTTWYYNDKFGTRRKTRGQTANAYMLAGAEEMRQSILSVAKEVFGE